ncbi:hypothetical protein Anapl_07256 [Anas platyrhynchos]|uniref:Uncharacterized protein n=1 Tax=Anas platyrhynchos TaxID=8839 RepID=R0JXV2_ANAPL|nr:hypothetical protein Anapl_07256 [Anas platyrhynchos]
MLAMDCNSSEEYNQEVLPARAHCCAGYEQLTAGRVVQDEHHTIYHPANIQPTFTGRSLKIIVSDIFRMRLESGASFPLRWGITLTYLSLPKAQQAIQC